MYDREQTLRNINQGFNKQQKSMEYSFKKHRMLAILLILFWTGNASCQQTQTNTEKIHQLESEMISFFQETLEKNYACKNGDAIQLLMEGLIKYDFHYIIDVDRSKIKEILNKNKEIFHEYFFDYPAMEKKRIKPERWMTDRPFDPYKPFGTTEFIIGQNASSINYLRSELSKSQHPLLKDVVKLHRDVGEFTFMVIWGKLKSNQYNALDSFKDNKEVQLFITIFFWEYLCYCANIDFVHTADKTSLIKANE